MTRPTERHGGIPAVQHLSDDELLRLLLGQDADALLSRHSLPDLFALHVRPPAVQEQHRNSSLADVSCYYLAQDTGRPLLTGDGRLRKQAAKDGIEVFGILWLLDQLVAHSVITPIRAADALEEMLKRSARLPHAECQHRLQLWR